MKTPEMAPTITSKISTMMKMATYSYDVNGVTVLNLKGSWHQMGCQYGTLAKEKMNDVLVYLDLKLGADTEKLNSAAKVANSLYLNYPDYLKVFFDGASQTSGICLERLKLCNAVEYVEGVFLCSAMAVWNDYGTGKLVFGRNFLDSLNVTTL